MVKSGIRGLLGAAAPPYTKPVTWANDVNNKYPYGTTPYIDFQGAANNNTTLNGDGAEMGACRQGFVRIQLTRTTAHGATWDGNSDLALRVYTLNSVSSGAYGGLKAIEAQARANQSCSSVMCVDLNARCSSGKTVAALQGLKIRCEIYGTVSTTLYGAEIQMSNEGAAVSGSAGVKILNNDASTANAITSGILFAKTGTNVGFDYLIDSYGTDCINTAVMRLADDGTVCNDTNATGAATTAGYITVVVGTATRYIYLSSTAPTA